MKRQGIESLFYARDVYSVWRRKVRRAQTSITIFTPFMDRILLSLLSTNSNLPANAITVITDIRPESIMEMPNQLITIKRILQKGIRVLQLGGLHAKVLLVDDGVVVIGSQNFTSRGRRNYEISAAPLTVHPKGRFTETVEAWREQAHPVEEKYIDLLLTRLRSHVKRHKKLLKDATESLRKVVEEHEEEKQNIFQRQLADLERQSQIRLAQGIVYASIKPAGKYDEFDSLKAGNGYDMTRWVLTKPDGSTEPYRLSRLSIYPMIIAETMRMGFARIGKTRISYFRKSLNWTNRILEVGDLRLRVSITFPNSDTRRRNISINLSHGYWGSCDCTFLFTGSAVSLISRKFHPGLSERKDQHANFIQPIEEAFFANGKAMDAFFQRYFEHFRYQELGRDRHNVREYLKGDRFRLSVIQYMDNPFLVIKSQQ